MTDDTRHPLEVLRHHVTGAIERGEAEPITAMPASATDDAGRMIGVRPGAPPELRADALNVGDRFTFAGADWTVARTRRSGRYAVIETTARERNADAPVVFRMLASRRVPCARPRRTVRVTSYRRPTGLLTFTAHVDGDPRRHGGTAGETPEQLASRVIREQGLDPATTEIVIHREQTPTAAREDH